MISISAGSGKIRRRECGFTLLELVLVLSIIVVLSASCLISIQNLIKNAHVNTALQTTLGMLREIHERAIDERKIYKVSISTPRTITVYRMDMISGSLTPVQVSSIDLPTDTAFNVNSGAPALATPNGFGNAGNAIDLDVNNVAGTTDIFFQPDGRVLDSANRIANGIVYVARPNEIESSRAVTIFGATGRIKAWRLQKSGSTVVWGQA
jgi:prepilin-type N-terminal cleavage/methylation domain-containing protein